MIPATGHNTRSGFRLGREQAGAFGGRSRLGGDPAAGLGLEDGHEAVGVHVTFVLRFLFVGEFAFVGLFRELCDSVLQRLIGVVVCDLVDLLGRENAEDWLRGAVEGGAIDRCGHIAILSNAIAGSQHDAEKKAFPRPSPR